MFGESMLYETNKCVFNTDSSFYIGASNKASISPRRSDN